MTAFEIGPEFTPAPIAAIAIPASEILRSPWLVAETWGAQTSDQPELLSQVETHAYYAASITSVLDALPDATTSIETALQSGDISQTMATDLYTSLGAVLHDEDNLRLVLYLPFELVPTDSWSPANEQLRQSLSKFKEAYLAAWYRLLVIHDVRANFVDGDVLEEAYRSEDVPRVIKAAHFIPQLVQRGLVDEDDMAWLMHITRDTLLQKSIGEGLMTLYGSPLLAEQPTSLDASEAISERRKAWLDEQDENRQIAASAQAIAEQVQADTLGPVTMTTFLSRHSLAEGIYTAIATTAAEDIAAGKLLYSRYSDILSTLASDEYITVQQRLDSVYRRLYHLGIVDRKTLRQHNVETPTLAGPLSENLALIQDDVDTLKHIATAIESHPELSQYVYPIMLLGGSRLKGYGERTSDIDVSVFIRPNTPTIARPYIRQMLNNLCTTDAKQYEPIEFWLDQIDDSTVAVRDFDTFDDHVADSRWTHLLFGGAWIGTRTAITDIQRQLLPGYFYTPEVPSDTDRVARGQYLERIEQDLLQYRLLHKGYARHYPLQPRERASYGEAIDGSSIFWDPGYRQLATRLFVQNVFLPKLKKI